jgi:hypothetical protein
MLPPLAVPLVPWRPLGAQFVAGLDQGRMKPTPRSQAH